MSKKNIALAHMVCNGKDHGGFMTSLADAYLHADTDNQAILDPAMDLLDQKYALCEEHIKRYGRMP